MDQDGSRERLINQPADTWDKLWNEKKVNLRQRAVEHVAREVNNVPLIFKEMGEISQEKDYANLGDYGNEIFPASDYENDSLYEALGINFESGQRVTAARLRQQIEETNGEKSRKIIGTSDVSRATASFDFFSQASNINFGTWLRNLGEEGKKRVEDYYNNLPPIVWLREVGEMIQGKQFEPILIGKNQKREREYFLKKLMVKKGEQTGIVKTGYKGVGLNIEENETGYKVELILDENELDGSSNQRQFLASRTAKDIFKVLDQCGLKLNEQVIGSITEGGCGRGGYSSRYGNGFADIFRLVSDGIGTERGIKKLFVEPKTEELLKMKENVDGAGPELSNAAKLWLKFVAGTVFLEERNEEQRPNFEYYRSGLSLHGDGACEDSENYLVSEYLDGKVWGDSGFVYFYNRGGDYDVAGGYHMAMTQQEIVVDGINLPPGFLCRVSGDREKVEPVRASMFCLEQNEAEEAFGGQYDKSKNYMNFGVGRSFVE